MCLVSSSRKFLENFLYLCVSLNVFVSFSVSPWNSVWMKEQIPSALNQKPNDLSSPQPSSTSCPCSNPRRQLLLHFYELPLMASECSLNFNAHSSRSLALIFLSHMVVIVREWCLRLNRDLIVSLRKNHSRFSNHSEDLICHFTVRRMWSLTFVCV